jgi:hypothetical protein
MPQRQETSAQSSLSADEEELDLDMGDKKNKAATEGSTDCDPRLPSGAPVGIWNTVPSASTCLAKQWAKNQAPLAYAIHDQLWCSDPGALKALARQKSNERITAHTNMAARRDAWERVERFRHPGLDSSVGFAELLKAQALAQRPPNPPLVPYYDPTQERPLYWDEREAEKCKNWQSAGPELGPSLSARALGKISTSTGTCDALLVEANMVSGRQSLSRLSWISSQCPGFSPPESTDVSQALSRGSLSAQAWQNQHFLSWRWQGPAPRDARGRSAEGF